MSNVRALCTQTGQSAPVEASKSEIVAALREWIDDVEKDPQWDPLRVVFVIETQQGRVMHPRSVGARTTALHAVGMLQFASHSLMTPE